MRELVKLHRADTGGPCWVDASAVVAVMEEAEEESEHPGAVLGVAGLPRLVAVRESVQEVLAALGLTVETL